MPRQDKLVSPSLTQRLQDLGYRLADWDASQTAQRICPEILQVLKRASKRGNGQAGYPDRIYASTQDRLLILVEEKAQVKDHDNPDRQKGAISGIQWYLSRFLQANLPEPLKPFFSHWHILGIALSGDISFLYQHKFSCYTLRDGGAGIASLPQVTNFLTHEQFLALFNTLSEEEAVGRISSSSRRINNLLRGVDSQKRPILLSALMICLHRVGRNPQGYINDFPTLYRSYSAGTLTSQVLHTVQRVLSVEGIPAEKLAALKTELAFLASEQTLNSTSILHDILQELESTVIPLFESRFATDSNYDIIGKFYEEFLRYAGISNVKRGIVLTPRHITTLFTKLVDLKENDRIVDLCCGTGAFLIAGMNALVSRIRAGERSDKEAAIASVKEKQLLGFELNATMYICAISNMLFRGDGKSSIFNYDSIRDPRAQEQLDSFGASIGFINPPYSGKENRSDPTPKEISFLAKMLDSCSRYGVIIAPLSTYFKDASVRERILQRHTLRYVINMPRELFEPNASTHTAIAVFETHRSFSYEKDEVTFYDLRDDGFVLSKTKGRTDAYGRWAGIESTMLDALSPTSKPNGTTHVRCRIRPGDEWTIYAHCRTDYSDLCEADFERSVTDYMLYLAKRDLGISSAELSEMEYLEALGNYFSGNEGIRISTQNAGGLPLNIPGWREFPLSQLFEVEGTKTTSLYDLETLYGEGEYPYVTTRASNNGVAGYYDHATEKGNVLVADSAVVGYVSYQERDFSASDHVELLVPKFEMTRATALFLRTILMKGGYRYAYGRKFNQERIKSTVLLLPSTPGGQVDFDFMERYIKSLPYADRLFCS